MKHLIAKDTKEFIVFVKISCNSFDLKPTDLVFLMKLKLRKTNKFEKIK